MMNNCNVIFEKEKGFLEKRMHSFLLENNNSISPPIISMPGGILGVLKNCGEKGGISIVEKNNDIVSFMGYLLEEYRLYIYLLIVDKDYRKKYSVSKNIISDIYRIGFSNKCSEVVFKAYRDDKYSNNIYRKLAYKTYEDLNAQGVLANKYHIKTDDLKRFFRET